MGDVIGNILAIVVIGFLLYIACFLIYKLFTNLIYFAKWLRMTPYEKEREKKRRWRRNYTSDSSTSNSWWSFGSGSSASDCGGGDGGGGGSCD